MAYSEEIGMSDDLAGKVAEALTASDALGAHAPSEALDLLWVIAGCVRVARRHV